MVERDLRARCSGGAGVSPPRLRRDSGSAGPERNAPGGRVPPSLGMSAVFAGRAGGSLEISRRCQPPEPARVRDAPRMGREEAGGRFPAPRPGRMRGGVGNPGLAPGANLGLPLRGMVVSGRWARLADKPSVAPGEPSVAPGEPSVVPGEPSVVPGEPSVAPNHRGMSPMKRDTGFFGRARFWNSRVNARAGTTPEPPARSGP